MYEYRCDERLKVKSDTEGPIRLTYTGFIMNQLKRELQRRQKYQCRYDERLKTKAEGSTRLTYTGCRGGLEH